jgi:hypothetical protein
VRHSRMRGAALVVVATLLGFGALRCTNDNAVLGTASLTAPAPGAPISLQRDVQPILTANCALSGCHGGSAPQLGLDLQDGKSYASLVGVASVEIPSLLRVEPGSSGTSYLVLKIEGDPSILGGRMPLSGSPLPSPEVQVIRDWIDQGAPDN